MIQTAKNGILLVAALALVAGPARADLMGTPVTPGSTPVTITAEAASNLANETLLATDLSNPLIGNPLISGNLANAVFRNSVGQLDFLYQLTNNAGSVPISTITVNNFAGFLAAAGTLTGTLPANASGLFTAGTAVSTNAERGSNGADVSFHNLALAPGQTTTVFFVHTNATSFNQLGQALVSATTSANGGAVATTKFEPTAVPEPSTLAGAALAALLGLGYARRRGQAG